MKINFRALTATLVLALVPVIAEAKLAKTSGASSAVFHAAGPGGLKIDGRTSEVSVADDGTHIAISVQLAGIDTGVSLRNKHMREKYLQTDKFPAAVLTVDRAALRFPAAGGTSAGTAPATLALHGQSHAVTLAYSTSNAAGTLKVTGVIPVNMTAYGIDTPSFLGASVKPDVTVDVSFEATDL